MRLKVWTLMMLLLSFSALMLSANSPTPQTESPEGPPEQSSSIFEGVGSILSPFMIEAYEAGVKAGILEWYPKAMMYKSMAGNYQEAFEGKSVAYENERRLRQEAEEKAHRRGRWLGIGLPLIIVGSVVAGLLIGTAL